MTTAELAEKIPPEYRNVAILLLSTLVACQQTVKPDFKYDEELFADPKYYPENAERRTNARNDYAR